VGVARGTAWRRAWPALVLGVLCGWAGSLRGQEAADAAPEPIAEAAAEEETPPAGGRGAVKPDLGARLRLEYDYRTQGDDSDSDFYGRLYASGRDLRDGRFDFYLAARVHSDLDSASSSLADDPFASVDDSDGVTEDRLMQAYADAHDRDKRVALRGGRQYVEVSDYLQMDGIQLKVLEQQKLGGRLYLGRPVSYYSSVSDDYALGVSLVGRPWEGNQSRLTYARYKDDSEDAADQNYFLDLRQQIRETSRLRGQLSILNEDFRMGRGDWFYYTPDGETDVALGASYWGSFDARTRAYSPLYQVLGEEDPYTQVYARLTQQVAPSWLVSPGISLRFADQSSNAFSNRDFENYDVTLIYAPSRTFSASLALEYWEVEHDDSFLGLSGDVRYRHGRSWEVSAGASFAEYTYDTFSDISYATTGGQTVFAEGGTIIEETPFVYTYSVRGRWRITRNLNGRLRFDVEDNDEFSDLAYRARGSIEVRY
jgi:hypothetical protein